MADIVTEPLKAVERFYKEAGCPTETSWSAAAQFKSALDHGQLEVPYLASAAAARNSPSNSLVRLYGMVHDACDPQFYQGAIRQQDGSWMTTKYGAAAPAGASLQGHIWERRPLYIVPVPGRSAWAHPATTAPANTAGAKLAGPAPDSGVSRDDTQPAVDQQSGKQQDREEAGSVDSAAAQQREGCAQHKAPTQGQLQLANNTSGGCIVYVYDADESISLHDVVEVVGVLSHTEEAPAWSMQPGSDLGMADGDDDDATCGRGQGTCGHSGACEHGGACKQAGAGGAQDAAAGPPKERADDEMMCIHAILVTRNPPPAPSLTAAAAPLSPERIARARSTALQLLSSCLGGDALAAEYLLLACLSRVLSRSPGQGVVGLMPLNLTGCPTAEQQGRTEQTKPANAQPDSSKTSSSSSSGVGSALHAALSALLPLCAYIPLSIDACNTGGWLPKRDPDTMRISRSPLQLPRGCVTLLDEVTLREGQLNEGGVRALQAVHAVLQDQVLAYDFEVYTHPFPVELPCVVLSEARSLLHTACTISLKLAPTQQPMTAEQVLGAVSRIEPSALEDVRVYLQQAAQADYSLSDEASKLLQAEFVAMRRANPNFSADMFQTQLTLARVAALSHGEHELSTQRWRSTQDMEAARRARAVA